MAWNIGGTIAADHFGYGWAAAGLSTAYTTRLDGGSSLDALRAGVIAGATSYAFQAADNYFETPAARVIAHGAIGGTSAELQGGSFVRGFAISAGTQILYLNALEMRRITIAQSNINPQNSSGISAGFNGDGYKTAGERCIVNVNCASQAPTTLNLGGIQGKQGSIASFIYARFPSQIVLLKLMVGPMISSMAHIGIIFRAMREIIKGWQVYMERLLISIEPSAKGSGIEARWGSARFFAVCFWSGVPFCFVLATLFGSYRGPSSGAYLR